MSPRAMVVRAVAALTTVGMVAGNVLAETQQWGGRSTAAVSAMFPVLVTPAGYVFAIWALIYVGMLAYSAAQFLEPLRRDRLADRLAPAIIVSNVANVTWLWLWHDLRIGLTVVVMLVLLVSLIAAYLIARSYRPRPRSSLERWAVRAISSHSPPSIL